jgi:sugar phosphate isomerase/epimerase
MKMKNLIKSILFVSACFFVINDSFSQTWKHYSTANNKISKPWTSTQQTASLILDIDNDGTNDFVVACRQTAPVVVWYQRSKKGWKKHIIEKELLTIEAGGAFYDIDNDGDKDLVFGGDWQSNQVWWWENPYPNYQAETTWKRYMIKKSGKNQHHDQIFGDFKGIGKSQLVFWNQGEKKLLIADIPENVKNQEEWQFTPIFSGEAGNQDAWYPEGLAKADIDNDGIIDLLAGNYWFKYQGNNTFKAIQIADIGGRVAVGKFKAGRYPQVVVSPGDGKGELKIYECTGNPLESANWKGTKLVERIIIHGHSLDLADINGDGNLDIFVAEMAKWSEKESKPDNPNAEAFIFYGDGMGNFKTSIFQKGMGFHEAKVADLDGDGDIDILNKPYNWEAPRLDVWLQNDTGKPKPIVGDYVSQTLGIQLYSLRNQITKDNLPEILKMVKSWGVNYVEGYSLHDRSPEQFIAEVKQAGLKCRGFLFGYDQFRDDVKTIIKNAKLMGVTEVGCAWIPHKGTDFTREDAEKAIQVFNTAGEALKKEGISFFYHIHGYEFVPSPEGTLFDLMVQKTNPSFCNYEMDIYWAFHGGQDPVLLLRKYPNRFLYFHLKDMKINEPIGLLTGSAPVESDVTIGTGQLPIPEIIREIANMNGRMMYIEDESSRSVQQIPNSIRFLKGLK